MMTKGVTTIACQHKPLNLEFYILIYFVFIHNYFFVIIFILDLDRIYLKWIWNEQKKRITNVI